VKTDDDDNSDNFCDNIEDENNKKYSKIPLKQPNFLPHMI